MAYLVMDEGKPNKRSKALIKDCYTISEVAELLGVGRKRIRLLAALEVDPMPFRCFKNQRRNAFILREDLIEWIEGHTVSVKDRKKQGALGKNGRQRRPWRVRKNI
jgi:hypothetical protein